MDLEHGDRKDSARAVNEQSTACDASGESASGEVRRQAYNVTTVRPAIHQKQGVNIPLQQQQTLILILYRAARRKSQRAGELKE